MNDAKRIIIIGSSGGGKSTLARQLGDITGLPVIHLDKEHWNPGWVETPKDIWQEKVKELLKGEQWIIDGNYGGTMKIRAEAADTIIYLDFNRFICLYRVIKRRLQNHGRTRPDMCEGCKEKIDFEFLKWVWTYPKKKPKVEKLLAILEGKNIIVLRSKKEVDGFLKQQAIYHCKTSSTVQSDIR